MRKSKNMYIYVFLFIIVFICISCTLAYTTINKQSQYPIILNVPTTPPIPIPVPSPDRNSYTQIRQPLRDWMMPMEFPPNGGITNIPINIPTLGLPEQFQAVGNINVAGQMLPLFGRRTVGSSNRWNYYTRTDTYNPVPLPIKFEGKDCMDTIGCNEIFTKDIVRLDGSGQTGQAHIFKINSPVYIPI